MDWYLMERCEARHTFKGEMQSKYNSYVKDTALN